jgi:NTE family protein
MLRSTSALLDRPTARAVLSRFGADGEDAEAGEDPEEDADQASGTEAADGAEVALEIPLEVPRKLGSFEVMNRTIEIAQSALARHTLATYPPDLLIEVPRSTCRSLEFHRAAEVIDAGRALANQALDALTIAADQSGPRPIKG